MNGNGKRITAAACITAILALGATAGTEAAWAAQHPGPPSIQQHRIPWQLTPRGLFICAEEHGLLRAYREFSADEHAGDVNTFAENGLPAPGQIPIASDFVRFGGKIVEFYLDCVLPYIQPAPREFPGGFVLPWYTLGPPPSGPSTKPPSGPPTTTPGSPTTTPGSPTTTPGSPPTTQPGDPPSPPFYTLGGGAG